MDDNKFMKIVHYICNKASKDNKNLGAIKLNKILWFIDKEHFKKYGITLTNHRYIKREFGPVPAKILSVLECLSKQNKIEISEETFGGYTKRKFLSKEEISLSGEFTEEQISLIDNLINDIFINN